MNFRWLKRLWNEQRWVLAAFILDACTDQWRDFDRGFIYSRWYKAGVFAYRWLKWPKDPQRMVT